MRQTFVRCLLLALCAFFWIAPAANARNRAHTAPAARIDRSWIDLKSIAGPLAYVTGPGFGSAGMLDIYDAHFHEVGQ